MLCKMVKNKIMILLFINIKKHLSTRFIVDCIVIDYELLKVF